MIIEAMTKKLVPEINIDMTRRIKRAMKKTEAKHLQSLVPDAVPSLKEPWKESIKVFRICLRTGAASGII